MSFSAIQEADNESLEQSDRMQFSGDYTLLKFAVEKNLLDLVLNQEEEFFCESLLISQDIAQKIVKHAIKTGKERQIQRDIPIHAMSFIEYTSITLAQLCVDMGYTNKDACYSTEDVEPPCAGDDPWRRNHVSLSTKDHEYMEYKDLVESQLEGSKQHIRDPSLNSTNSRFSRTQAKPNEKKREVDIDPQPVPLQLNFDDDEYQEKLRNAKAFDQKRRQDMETKQQIEKQKLPKPERGETGPKKYVFDFDGSLLVSRQLKVEKLNPATTAVGFHVVEPREPKKEATTVTGRAARKKQEVKDPKDNVPTFKLNNRALEERKETVREALGDKAIKPSRDLQFPYENFNMNGGVTLFFESKMKEGLKSQVTDSLDKLTSKLKGANIQTDPSSNVADPLRLTRTEYQLLTQYGSMHKTQTKTYYSTHQETEEKPGAQQKSREQQQGSQVKKTRPRLKFLEGPNAGKSLSHQHDSLVKLVNNKHLQRLVDEEDTPLQLLERQKASQLKEKEGPPPAPRNPIDQFNQTLLTSKDWGKLGQGQVLPPIQNKHEKNSDPLQHRQSLEQLYKMPRDRLTAQNQRVWLKAEKSDRKSEKATITPSPFQTFYTTHSKFSEILRIS